MTDTIQDFSAPPEPAPAADHDDPSRQLTQRGRPSKVVERDLAIARVLAEGERSKHEVMAALGLEWRVTYNSLCRLRDRGLVELNRNGTRTPTWRVTDAGHAWLGTATVPEPAGDEPVPEAPSAPPTPPEPTPVAVVPTPPPPEEPGAQPVPISPPPPEPEPAPTGVAPSPGPTEPVWPI